MVHLDKNKKNKLSTQHTPGISAEKYYDHATLKTLTIVNTDTTKLIFAAIGKTGHIYTDQIVQLHIASSKRNKYICLMYDYKASSILTEPFKNWTGQEILRAYSKLPSYLT